MKTVVTPNKTYNVELKNIAARALSYKSIELTWDKLSSDVQIDIYRNDEKIARVSAADGKYIDSGEYSCAVKPHVRSDGNRQSGAWEPPVRDLLAQCFI